METKVFSRCGMRCDLCLIYRPNVEKKDRRVEICAVYRKIFPGYDANPDSIICDGCLCERDDAVLQDPGCKARKCVMEKGHEHCGYCEQYPCDDFPAEPSHEELVQKIEVEKQWTWEDEKLMEAYTCKKNMDEFRKKPLIYKATKKDATKIAKLAIQMWEDNTVEELAEEFTEMIESDEAVIFLAEDEQPIGFAQCQLRHDYVEGTGGSPVGYLEGIFVAQEYRKKGFAKQLLGKCEEWAKEKGCLEFASDCELDNDISLAFHLKMGFAEANRIICFTKEL